MTVIGGSSGELQVQVMIRNPTSGNALTADEAYESIIMSSKIYVGNMSFQTTETVLRETFSQFGTVTEVYIASDRETGRPRGFAFVTMGTAEEAQAAIGKLNGVDLDGRALTVNEAKPKESFGGNRRAGAFNSGGGNRY
jgi:RNA recognition motif-containing protein